MLAEVLPRLTKLSGLWLDPASRGPDLAAELGAAADDPPLSRRQGGVSGGGNPPGAGGGGVSASPGLGTLIVAALCGDGVGLSRL